jgi:hypothetical protein
MRQRVRQLLVFLFCLTVLASPALAQGVLLPHQDIREFLPVFFRDTARAIDEQIQDKMQFVEEFFDYKKAVDNRLSAVLGDLAGIINDYAEHRGGLSKSSQQLGDDLKEFYARYHPIADDFPRAEEVKRIVKPHMDRLTAVLTQEFPVLGPMPAQGFPLGHFYEFFQEAERRNSFGMGAFFRVEPLKPHTTRRTYASRIRYVNEGGVASEDVIYEESQTFEDDEPVAHRLVRDNALLINEARREDFSVLHGLPAAMRRDGMNERFIRIVEEYINLVNYYVMDNYRNRGLIIPADHPQLAVPPGYTPETFIKNFIALILVIQTPGPS